MQRQWGLDRSIVFLNHGSFGAAPLAVLEEQRRYRDQMEREPVRFFARELEPLLDAARAELAAFLGADPAGLAFVTNATAAVNGVLRSMDLREGDELLTTTHEYNASRNVLEYAAGRAGARVRVVDVPFPISSPDDVVERLVAAVTDRTRLLLVDHVTSQTALVFPIEEIVAEMAARGVETFVDGAHAPGMIPLDLRRIGAAYYTGNLHKWVCAPKGSAFLYVAPERRGEVRPASISHGANSTRTDRSRFHLEFDWTGTFDPTPWLTVPQALRTMAAMLPGGWPELMRHNHDLAVEGRDILCAALQLAPPAPDSMLGSMAAVPLPPGTADAAPSLYGDPLQDALLERFSIEVPIVPWPGPPHRLVRISAQLYNDASQYRFLARALRQLLAEERP